MSLMTAEDIEKYLSQTSTLEWAHVPQFFFASLDGRNDEKNGQVLAELRDIGVPALAVQLDVAAVKRSTALDVGAGGNETATNSTGASRASTVPMAARRKNCSGTWFRSRPGRPASARNRGTERASPMTRRHSA